MHTGTPYVSIVSDETSTTATITSMTPEEEQLRFLREADRQLRRGVELLEWITAAWLVLVVLAAGIVGLLILYYLR